MSQIYSIKNLLNIKDKNITFTENGISMENFKGVYSKIIHAKLSYSPNQCPHCHGKDIIKWGSKTSNIRLLKILEYNSILRLQKQRFRCKDCGKTFSAETDIVDKNCCISNDVKLAITLKLQKIFLKKTLLLILMFLQILLIESLILFLRNIYLIKIIFLKLYALMNLKLLMTVKELWLSFFAMQIMVILLIFFLIGAYHI